MKNIIFITLFYLTFPFIFVHSQSPSVPTPCVNSVNVIDGQIVDPFSHDQYEYYNEGKNDVGGVPVFLSAKDFRIGRVKVQKIKSKPNVYFFYFPGYTEVFDAHHQKTLYRYTKDLLIESVEQYTNISKEAYLLYRKEQFYWDQSFSNPKLISRYLLDEKGNVHLGYLFKYNKQGLLVKETFLGNLSGQCESSLSIQSNGLPKPSDVETYSIAYEYGENSNLLLREKEDNGCTTTYQYDPKTLVCTAKLKGNHKGLVSRCFYFYDELGFLSRTILDDGCLNTFEDLTGATFKQIILTQCCQEGTALGQPLVTETKYLDLDTEEEKLLEKIVYTYAEKGYLVRTDYYDANGSLSYYVSMHYDEKGHLESTVDSRGEAATKDVNAEYQRRYNDLEQCEALIDRYGNETHYFYDDLGRLTKTIYPSVLNENDQPYQSFLAQSYDLFDNIWESQNSFGCTQTSYNIRKKPIQIQYPDNTSESFVYFLDGTLKETIDRYGNKTTYERDCFGRVETSHEYTPDGMLVNTLLHTYKGAFLESITNNKTFTIHYCYDGAGREIGTRHETKDGIRRQESSYDASGKKTETREWYGTQEQEFVSKIEEKDGEQKTIGIRIENGKGELQHKIKPQTEQKELFSQDHPVKNERNQFVRQLETIDTTGMKELITYDALSRPETILVIDSFGNKISEKHLRYDDKNNKISEKHFSLIRGKPTHAYTINWNYDSFDHLIRIQETGDHTTKTTTYTYNSKGHLENIVKPDGRILHFEYNSRGMPIQFNSSDGSISYQYRYDELGRLESVEDLIHSYLVKREYDAFNNILTETFNDQFSIKNQFDLAGRRVALTLPDTSQVLYHYSGALLEKVQRMAPKSEFLYQQVYKYDTEGRLTQSQLIGDLGAISYGYDQQSRIQSIDSPWWSESIPENGFDKNNNLHCVTINDRAGTKNSSYTYTPDYQLQSEAGSFNHQFEYDSLRNRISHNGEKWTVNALNQLTKTTDAIYHYDFNGNLSCKEDQDLIHYQYDALNRLIRIEKNQEIALKYLYDPFNRRVAQTIYKWCLEEENWKIASQEYFLFDGEKEIGKMNGDGAIQELRILGLGKGAEIGTAIALELQNKVYAPIHDHQGSVRCLVDVQNKQIAEFYRYSAYGLEEIYDGEGIRLHHSSIGNPWRFSSKRYDEESHLIFYGNRYYDPTVGRWISPDPLFFYDSPNLYAFVKNNPVTHYDLYGLFSIESIWNKAGQYLYQGFVHLENTVRNLHQALVSELKIPKEMGEAFEKVGKKFLGEGFWHFFGYHTHHPSQIGSYGKGELNDKVRITFINGILTGNNLINENLDLISKSHGGVNVHYVFRSTEGWTWDVGKAILIKFGFQIGFRSHHAYLLAKLWKELIHELGGVGNGGVIIHYAHSLGGSDTDRAKSFLSPEELKMIRVITFGSATLVRNEGYQSVINYISVRDGVSCFLIEPLGHIRNYFDPKSNVIWLSHFFAWPIFPGDHPLSWKTYRTVLSDYGERFLKEFAPQ